MQSVRDDTIAYWEAYQRDLVVSDCMAAAGFTWYPEALYPPGAVLEIADSLGIQHDSQIPSKNAAMMNAEFIATLGPQEIDDYYLAMYGLDAASVEQINRDQGGSGEIDLGSAGCSKHGTVTEDSIWALRDRLEPDVAEARNQFRESGEHAQWILQAQGCAGEFGIPDVTDHAAADKAMDEGADPALVTEMLQSCGSIWDARGAAENQHVGGTIWEMHEADLVAQQGHYEQVWQQITADEDFMAFVSAEAGS